MVRPALRSRSYRKISYKTPGAKNKKRYERRKTTKNFCALCEKKILGASTEKSLSKTAKKAGRKFSGELCSSCSRDVTKTQTRLNDGSITLKEISVKMRKYLR